MLVPHQQQKRLPPTWKSVPLGYLTTVIGGSTPSKDAPEYWGGEVPWVSPKDMKVPVIHDSQDHVTVRALQETALRMVQPPAVLIVVRGMILAHSFPTALIARPVTINQDMKALLASSRVEDRFLRYSLDAYADVLLSVVEESGHGTRCLRSDLWTKVEVPTPPRAAQRAIADFLDRKTRAIDELIRKKERLIELLQEKRQALITQAVTKGLPAEAAATPGLDPTVPMKDSGVPRLGEIPAHWEVVPLRWRTRVGSGDFIASTDYAEEREAVRRFPVIGGNGVSGWTDQVNCTKSYRCGGSSWRALRERPLR